MTYTSYIKPLENKLIFLHQLFQTFQTQEHNHYIKLLVTTIECTLLPKWGEKFDRVDSYLMIHGLGNQMSNISIGCYQRSM
jgi:hypothetical protein